MHFSKCETVDILRCTQRDESFVREMQDNVGAVIKLLGVRRHHSAQRIIPALTNLWYYFATTMGNLQTLGEEYANIIRFNEDKQLPSKTVELVWLLLYIGGEPLYDRCLQYFQKTVEGNHELTEESRTFLLKLIIFCQQNKQTFRRIHHCLFYINGEYYNISNRLMGIKYVLLREWLKDDTFTHSFKLLGQLSLFYIIISTVKQLWNTAHEKIAENPVGKVHTSNKGCVLCAENRKNPCATPCGHIFCWNCICDSLSYQQVCPICREELAPSRIILLQNYV